MKILWLDLNSSYAHSSLALPALHAQIKDNLTWEWDRASATVNENPGMIAGEISRKRPDMIAATCWLFNHEALIHILSRVHALLPQCRIILGGPEFLGDNEGFLRIKTEEIFYAMVNSIKELCSKLQDLTAKVSGLDKRITELENQNKVLIKQNKAFEERLEKLEKQQNK